MLTLDEFTQQVEAVYTQLPLDLQERFNISIDEENTSDLGYFNGYFPTMIHLCFKTFQRLALTEQDIRNVIYHELEHLLMPWWHPHSQHLD